MGIKRWTVEHTHDPDDGCCGCPFLMQRDGLAWCCSDPHCGAYVRLLAGRGAPDWCPLRALPDAEEVERG